MKVWNRIVITLICGLIVSLSLITLITPDKAFSSTENRYLASFPKWSWEALISGTFGKELEKYAADQFPLREYWLTAKAWLEIGLNKKENNDVYAGKNGYLLQKIPSPAISLSEQMDYVNQFSEALEIPVYFMLAPNSAFVHSDQMPSFAPIPDQKKYIEEACALLDSAFCVQVHEQLMKHRDEYIYFRTDHHWTTLGAYVAYQTFAHAAGLKPLQSNDFEIERVSDSFFGSLYARSNFRHVKPDAIDVWLPKGKWTHTITYMDNGKVTDSMYAWEHLNNRDQYPLFLGGNHALTHIETTEAPDRTILVIKDSYAHTFVPLLAPHYNNIYMADLRYLNMSIADYARSIRADEVLLLYNAASFQEDNNLVKLKW